MNEKLSLLASVAVIGIVLYSAWLLSSVDTARLNRINNTIKAVSDTVGTDSAPAGSDSKTLVLYSGAAILFVATIYVLFKKK